MATATDHESHKMFNGVEKRREKSKNLSAKLIRDGIHQLTSNFQKPDWLTENIVTIRYSIEIFHLRDFIFSPGTWNCLEVGFKHTDAYVFQTPATLSLTINLREDKCVLLQKQNCVRSKRYLIFYLFAMYEIAAVQQYGFKLCEFETHISFAAAETGILSYRV